MGYSERAKQAAANFQTALMTFFSSEKKDYENNLRAAKKVAWILRKTRGQAPKEMKSLGALTDAEKMLLENLDENELKKNAGKFNTVSKTKGAKFALLFVDSLDDGVNVAGMNDRDYHQFMLNNAYILKKQDAKKILGIVHTGSLDLGKVYKAAKKKYTLATESEAEEYYNKKVKNGGEKTIDGFVDSLERTVEARLKQEEEERERARLKQEEAPWLEEVPKLEEEARRQKEKEEKERKEKEEVALRKKEDEDRRKKEKEERDKLIKELNMEKMVAEAKSQQEQGKPWGYYIQNQRASDGWSAEHGSVVLRFPKKEVGGVALLDTKGQCTKYASLTYEIDGPHLLVFYADGSGVKGELPWPIYEKGIMKNGSELSAEDKKKLVRFSTSENKEKSLRDYENKGEMAKWNWEEIK